jgi:hypothetical protein
MRMSTKLFHDQNDFSYRDIRHPEYSRNNPAVKRIPNIHEDLRISKQTECSEYVVTLRS